MSNQWLFPVIHDLIILFIQLSWCGRHRRETEPSEYSYSSSAGSRRTCLVELLQPEMPIYLPLFPPEVKTPRWEKMSTISRFKLVSLFQGKGLFPLHGALSKYIESLSIKFPVLSQTWELLNPVTVIFFLKFFFSITVLHKFLVRYLRRSSED